MFTIYKKFNIPNTNNVVILRSALYAALYLQIAGRGMRTSN